MQIDEKHLHISHFEAFLHTTYSVTKITNVDIAQSMWRLCDVFFLDLFTGN